MSRHIRMIHAAAMVALFATPLQAVEIFWQGSGVSGTLTDPNYSDGVNTNLTPTANDIIDFGGGGTATYSVAGPVSYQKLRVGHGQTAPGGVGAGTVTIDNGAQVTLTVGATGNANASLWVGNLQNGTLTIDGANTSLTAAQIIMIGYGNSTTRNGTVNVTNGAALKNLAGNVNIGDRTTGVGLAGHLNISGSGSVFNMGGTTGDLNVGIWATSSYLQSDGVSTVADQIIVGQKNTDGTSFGVTGGTLTAGGAMTLSNGTVAEGYSDNVSASFTGTAGVTVGSSTVSSVTYGIAVGAVDARNTSLTISDSATLTTQTSGVILVGQQNALNSSLTVSGNAILNLASNITVGTDLADGSSLTVSGSADINIPGTASAGNIFIGRGTSKNSTFTMTGGTIDLGNHFLMGTATSPGATNILGIQSGGTITTTNNFVLADNFGASTYNLSGSGAINANGLVIVGRQSAAAVMNQTGGIVTAALGVNVGNAQNGTTTLWGTGTYNVSGGTITANSAGNALSIGTQGTGTFRVIGDDAMIDVNGNMLLNTVVGTSQGTLAFQLETGDLLSQIDVSGTATFTNGSILNFDTSLASPTQTTYNVLTAATFVGIDSPNDPDITFTGPAGWGFQLVPGGNGQILQLYQLPPPGLLGDFNSDGKVDAGDYATWRKNDGTSNALANDNGLGTPIGPAHYDLWRANFGNPPGAGASLEGAQVPEPASLMLVLVGATALVGIRRR